MMLWYSDERKTVYGGSCTDKLWTDLPRLPPGSLAPDIRVYPCWLQKPHCRLAVSWACAYLWRSGSLPVAYSLLYVMQCRWMAPTSSSWWWWWQSLKSGSQFSRCICTANCLLHNFALIFSIMPLFFCSL